MPTKDEMQRKINKNEARVVENEGGKSDIWNLFGRILDQHSLAKGFVACKACKKVYVYQPSDGTQTLRRHQCDKGESGPKAKKSLSVAKQQQQTPFNWTSAGFSASKKDGVVVPGTVKTELNRTAVLACALDFRPLSFTSGEGFQLLAQSLIELGVKYPNAKANTLFNSQSTFSRKVLPQLASEAMATIKTSLCEQFKSMPKTLCPAAFTADHWTDKYRQIEYTSIAVSYVDVHFKLNEYDLCIKEYTEDSKHAHCIRNDIMSKLKDFDVSEDLLNRDGKFVFVTDSDAKLVAAIREDFDRQSCVAHDLSLVVKHALKATEKNTVGITIEACKTLVRFFKQSGLNRQLTKTLKQEISTRFNSVFAMLNSLDDVFEEVTTILTANENLTYLTDIKRKTLQAVAKQLKRFDEATRKVAAEKQETLHLVIPVLHELHSKLQKEADKYRLAGEPDMAALCKELVRGLTDKCLSKVTWYHCAATVLYPPLLQHPALLCREGEVAQIRSDFQVLMTSFTNDEVTNGPPRKKVKKLLSDSDSEDGDDGGDSRNSPDEQGTDVDKYFNRSSSYECENITPLQFWNSQATQLPNLSVVARSVFAVPATQNKSERAFSGAGNVLTDMRSTLDPEHVHELLLIRSHHRHSCERTANREIDNDQ